LSFGWHIFVFLTYGTLLDEKVDVSGPFRPIEGSGYALESGLDAEVATVRGSMELRHDTLAKVVCCWHKNLVAKK